MERLGDIFPLLQRLHNVSIWKRLVLSIAAMLCLAWGVMIFWTAHQQESLALHQAKDLAMSVNQMTMANLLFMKVTKTIKKRKIYYDQVQQSEAIKDLRVLRGQPVIHEMGDGDEIAMNPNEIEKEALSKGKTIFREVEDPKHGHVLLAIFPAIAERNYLGRDCMECHEEVKEGDILGAVSMKVSLADLDEVVKVTRQEFVLATVLISIPLLAFVFLFVRSFVTRPLAFMVSNLNAIANGEGDLRSRLPVRGRDEIGQASKAFNSMMEKLHSLIVQINGIACQVARSSENLGTRIADVTRGSITQAAQSEEAAAALDEIAASVCSVSESCAQVRQRTLDSQERAVAGKVSLESLQTQIHQVEDSVGNIAQKVERFVSSTVAITKMTQEVKDIADQTNLLALNAAIEAARAGDLGRGFAVVADEVRKLAEKSARSAAEIDRLTASLGNESVSVRHALEHGREALNATHSSVSTVSQVLDGAAHAVDDVVVGMNQVHEATEQQEQASGLVSSQVDAIAGLARNNGDLLSTMNDSMQELAQLAQNLRQELGRFKT